MGLLIDYAFPCLYPAKIMLKVKAMTRPQNPRAIMGILVRVVVFTKEEAIIMKNSIAFVRIKPGIIRCMGCKQRQTGITAERNTISAAIEINSISVK